MVINLIWKRSLLGISLLLWGGCKPSPPGGPGPSGLTVSSPSAAQPTAQPGITPSPIAAETPKPIASPNLPPLSPAEQKELEQSKLLDGYRELAFELLHILSKDLPKDKNLIFSPYSIGTSLTLLYLAATGNTKKELGELLRIQTLTDEQVIRELSLLKRKEFFKEVSYEAEKESINVFISPNSFQYLPHFLQLTHSLYPYFLSYPKEQNLVSFFNQWMYTQNHQLFHTSTLPSDIRFTQNLGLLNSLYMRAHWFYSYEPEKTQTRQFTTETGLIKAHSFMRIDPTINYPNNPRDGGKDVSYSQVLGAEAISQDLAWGYEMMIIRPTEKSALSWAQIATVGEWYTLKSGMEVYGIQELVMPRWRQEQNHNLLSLLQKLNLPTFNQNPDLSKLLEKPLKLEFIQHHTALDIDEKGLNGGTKDPRGSNLEEPKKQLSFAVDKPFFYTIHNKYTNAILYMGIVNDPTQP